MPRPPPSASGPLAGIVVVDLTRVLAGPYCTMVLADLGARVIKVEAPGRGDDARHIGPFIDGRSAYFDSVNRGKQSIALDLKNDADRDVLERLLAGADVLVENFRPGVMTRLGLAYEQLHVRFPSLVYAAASGFGQTGPYRERAAFDMVVQAMGGIMSVTGHPGAPPTRVGTSIGDIGAGLFTAIGILSALRHRDQTDEGLLVDVAMLDSQVAILENAIARFSATGRAPEPLGSRHPSIAPFAAFETADGHVVIAAGNDRLFGELVRAIGRPELASAQRFTSNALRTEHAEALAAELEGTLRTRSSTDWLQLLGDAGIPCGPIQDVAQVLSDPQVLARNMVIEAEGAEGSSARMAGNPIKLSGYPDPPARPRAPGLDEDRARILAELEA